MPFHMKLDRLGRDFLMNNLLWWSAQESRPAPLSTTLAGWPFHHQTNQVHRVLRVDVASCCHDWWLTKPSFRENLGNNNKKLKKDKTSFSLFYLKNPFRFFFFFLSIVSLQTTRRMTRIKDLKWKRHKIPEFYSNTVIQQSRDRILNSYLSIKLYVYTTVIGRGQCKTRPNSSEGHHTKFFYLHSYLYLY